MMTLQKRIFPLLNPVILLCGILVFPGPGFAGDDPPLVLTLEKALAMALEQNRDVLIAARERTKADAQENEAIAGALPQITVSGNYTRNIKKPVLFIPPNSPINPSNTVQKFELGSDNAYTLGASLSQPLFSKKVGVALDIANLYGDYADKAVLATEQDVIRQVKRAFYGILLARKLVDANRQGYDVVRANFDNVQSQYRHGSAAEFDLLRAEVQLANTEPLLISAENALALATNALKNLLAIPLDRDVVVQGEFAFEDIPRATLDAARENALTANPTIAGLLLQESLLEKNISIVRAAYFPTLNLTGSYQWQTQDNSFQFKNYNWANSLNFGLQLSYTLFDGFATGARAQQAMVDKEKVHFTRLKAEEGLKIQIQSAELRMIEARKRIGAQEKSLTQAEKAVGIAQTRYKSGVGTQLELLDTQVAMTRAQTNYAQAIYDYLIAMADWQYAVGQKQ
jgi:outer membrane protein